MIGRAPMPSGTSQARRRTANMLDVKLRRHMMPVQNDRMPARDADAQYGTRPHTHDHP